MHLHQDYSLYKCCPKKRQDNSVICYAFYYFKSCYRFHKMNLNLLIPVNGGEEKKKGNISAYSNTTGTWGWPKSMGPKSYTSKNWSQWFNSLGWPDLSLDIVGNLKPHFTSAQKSMSCESTEFTFFLKSWPKAKLDTKYILSTPLISIRHTVQKVLYKICSFYPRRLQRYNLWSKRSKRSKTRHLTQPKPFQEKD